MFFSYLYNQNYFEKIKDKANGGGIKDNHLQMFLIPSSPPSKQQEIAKEYYNKTPKIKDFDPLEGVTLDSYLEQEKDRNKELGIYQLNMEIFELREKLEDLVYKIVNEEEIKIEEYV
jgi:hypothetical protein